MHRNRTTYESNQPSREVNASLNKRDPYRLTFNNLLRIVLGFHRVINPPNRFMVGGSCRAIEGSENYIPSLMDEQWWPHEAPQERRPPVLLSRFRP